jgi:hypothetical protein
LTDEGLGAFFVAATRNTRQARRLTKKYIMYEYGVMHENDGKCKNGNRFSMATKAIVKTNDEWDLWRIM